jgi:hypothetical protein
MLWPAKQGNPFLDATKLWPLNVGGVRVGVLL